MDNSTLARWKRIDDLYAAGIMVTSYAPETLATVQARENASAVYAAAYAHNRARALYGS